MIMLNERQRRILEILGFNNRTSVNELARQLDVSSVTIRQDLNHLESQGLLKRIHGGAVLKDGDDLDNRLGINYEKKLRIARKLAGHVVEGETILIAACSTERIFAAKAYCDVAGHYSRPDLFQLRVNRTRYRRVVEMQEQDDEVVEPEAAPEE